MSVVFFFFQAEDGIRYLVRSRGLGDVYKRQAVYSSQVSPGAREPVMVIVKTWLVLTPAGALITGCLLYTSDAADERSSVDLGGRRIIKKKKTNE